MLYKYYYSYFLDKTGKHQYKNMSSIWRPNLRPVQIQLKQPPLSSFRKILFLKTLNSNSIRSLLWSLSTHLYQASSTKPSIPFMTFSQLYLKIYFTSKYFYQSKNMYVCVCMYMCVYRCRCACVCMCIISGRLY